MAKRTNSPFSLKRQAKPQNVVGIVQVRSESGHRRGYRDLFSELLGLTPETGPIRGKRFLRLLSAPFVLIGTMDCDYLGALTLLFARGLLGRPTTALLLRPQTCFLPGWRFHAKLIALGVGARLPQQKILTIVPFSVRPEFAKVATDWIYDPEIWDLTARGNAELPKTRLSRQVSAQAAGRPVLSVLGAINQIKGFNRLYRLLSQSGNFATKLHVVIAGPISPDVLELANELATLGAHVEDRYLTDNEILSLYGVTSFAWCSYSPEYDQASGIFGRAVQTGVVPIVRRGSILEALAKELEVEAIVLGELTVDEIVGSYKEFEGKAIRNVINVAEMEKRLVYR